VVHNLYRLSFSAKGGYDWAQDFDHYIKDKIKTQQHQDVIDYKKAGKSAELAFVTPEHFYPLLFVLGASNNDDRVLVYNDSLVMGSISMTSFVFTNY
jgi:4,5-DOPA dioxygenase extradiol